MRSSSKKNARSLGLWHLESKEPVAKSATVALAPGELVPIYHLDLPNVLRDTLRRQVARSELESLLQRDLDGLEFRVSQLHGTDLAVLVDCETATSWRTRVAQAQSGITTLLPDYLAVDAKDGDWVIYVAPQDPTRILARLGAHDGFSARVETALLHFTAVLRCSERPGAIYVDGDLPLELATFFADHDISMATTSDSVKLASKAPELEFNLLKDPEADLREMSLVVKRWRGPMVAMVLGITALATALWVETDALHRATSEVRTQATLSAREAFLPTGPILNLREQVGRVIASRQQNAVAAADTGPIDLLYVTATVLTVENVSVKRLQVTRSGTVRAEVNVDDFAMLESIVDRLTSPSATARVISSAANLDSGVGAEIEILRVR